MLVVAVVGSMVLCIAILTTPQAGRVPLSVVSTLGAGAFVYTLITAVLFKVTITPTDLEWSYFRTHTYAYGDMREIRITGERPGGKILTIHGCRRADRLSISTANLTPHTARPLIARLSAPHASQLPGRSAE